MTVTKPKTTSTKPKTIATKQPVETTDLPANPFTFEVLNLITKQRTNAKKVEILQKHGDASLKAVLIWNYDESLISALPEGDVPYASVGEQNSFTGTMTEKIGDAVTKMGELGSNSLGSQDQGRSSIRKEFKRFYNFIRGCNDGLSSLRRETMFINVLQGLHPLEAEILILIKDKKLETKYKIGFDNVKTAFPDIQWGGRV